MRRRDCGERVPTPVTTARVILLVLVAFGVAGMHTLGHPRAGQLPASHVVSAGSDHHSGVTGLVVTGRQTPAYPPGHDFDTATVCLAILAAAGLVLCGSASTVNRRAMSGTAGPATDAQTALGRAPPQRGLMLADLAVLRI